MPQQDPLQPQPHAASCSVVNVRVQYIRPQYANLREWMADRQNVYIGRPGIVFLQGERFPKRGSVFANPFKGAGALERYERYIHRRLACEPTLVNELRSLRGKRLGCWCHPAPCHGDVLRKLLDDNTLRFA
jgi:hypothetical protein